MQSDALHEPASTLPSVPPGATVVVSCEPLAVSRRDIARLLGLSTRTIDALVASGSIPFVRVGGKGSRVVFPLALCRAWLRKQAVGAEGLE